MYMKAVGAQYIEPVWLIKAVVGINGVGAVREPLLSFFNRMRLFGDSEFPIRPLLAGDCRVGPFCEKVSSQRRHFRRLGCAQRNPTMSSTTR